MKNEQIIQVLKSCLDRAKDMHRYYWKRGHYCSEDNALWEVTTREIDALAEAVETFEQLHDDESVSRWICVNDQMPDSGERVLVCCGTFVCEAYCDINGYFYRTPQEQLPEEDAPYPITHWMHLPEPPASVVSTVCLEEDTHD